MADPNCHAALEILCERYWYPVYSYIRHRGCDRDTTEDDAYILQLTQNAR